MYVEFGGDSDDHNVGFTRSRLYRLLDRHQNTIRLLVNVPKMSINSALIRSLLLVSLLHRHPYCISLLVLVLTVNLPI